MAVRLKRNGSGPRDPDEQTDIYPIDGSAVFVWVELGHGRPRWSLCSGDDDPRVLAWLMRTGLHGVEFSRRREVLRAYEAASAIDPPPAPPLLPKLVRVSSGVYRTEDRKLLVRRVTGLRCPWVIVGAADPATILSQAASLHAAQSIMTDTLTIIEYRRSCPPVPKQASR